MNNYYNNYGQSQVVNATKSFPILMRKVYTWMALAMVITGITAYEVASSPILISIIFSSRITFWGLMVAEFALVWGISGTINKISLTTATLMFILYSIINGATLSSIFLLYTSQSIGSVFFVTAATFGAMSLYGYITRRDLTSIGKMLFMALIGIIIATIVNMFIGSSGMQMAISYIGVIVFIGLTAYDSQKIKQMLITQNGTGEGAQKQALIGALSLYLDFVNLFLYFLRIFGDRK